MIPSSEELASPVFDRIARTVVSLQKVLSRGLSAPVLISVARVGENLLGR
jgi:hypothetical protein